MAREELSACRNRAYLAAVLEGKGNRAAQLAELDQSKAILEPLKASSIWSARLGVLYARAGRQDVAEGLRKAAAKSVRPADAQEMSYLHRLEGEIELARGRPAPALVNLRLADREFQSGLTLESLAHGEWSAGNVAEAVTAYETLLTTECLGWEAQQPWVTAHYSLALAYRSAGQREKARAVADRFLALWKDADPDLALRRRVHELRRELDRPSGESSR
jgi:tetratricopeptide (TPR) repeat protein